MSKCKQDAAYLYEHYKQGGKGLAELLYQRIIKTEKLKPWEAVALKNEFVKLLKAAK